MSDHRVVLKVSVLMDEMDGTTEQSAEIALNLATELLLEQWPKQDLEVECLEHEEVGA